MIFMNKIILGLILLLSISFATWTEADCKQACADADMKFTAWASDSPPEPCDDVQMDGPDDNGLVTYSCQGSDGTAVFQCGCRTQCADGDDNDNGGKVDLDDPGCEDKKDNDETSQCDDGEDNDAGGKTDMDDPGCEDKEDNDETSQCDDGIDNDGDEGIDMGDPGCKDKEDDNEEQKVCKFSILVTGGVDDANNDAFFWRETQKKYEMLNGTMGIPGENIYLLFFNGSINRTHDDARIDGPASIAQIEAAINDIAEKAKECTDRCDNVEITFFAGNHGAPDGLNLFGNEKLSPAKLRTLLNKIKNKANKDKMSIWLEMSQCYAGIFSPLSDMVNGVATSVQANNTASYNVGLDRSFQLAFTDALIAGKSWKDAFTYARDKTQEWGWNDTEFPEYGGTGAVCGDGKIAKSKFFGNQKEDCDPGNVTTSRCPGNKICNDKCKCVEALYYMDCVNEICIKQEAAEAQDDHVRCVDVAEGQPCTPEIFDVLPEDNDTEEDDGFLHPYLDCIDEVCTWATSPYAMNNHPDCSSEGQSCDMEDTGPYEYLACVNGECVLAMSSTPMQDDAGCVNPGDSCSEVPTEYVCLECVGGVCIEVEYSEPCEDACSEEGEDCGAQETYEYLACVDETCVLAMSTTPMQNDPRCGQAGDSCAEEAPDRDEDGISDYEDNCPDDANPAQSDVDNDGLGDVCDPCPFDRYNDRDNDEICGDEDNCPDTSNPGQEDSDQDTIGDACDVCPEDPQNDVDKDGVCMPEDNCEFVSNPLQSDLDEDGIGDHCDPVPVNCEEYCAENGFPEVVGTGIGQAACYAFGELPEENCKTICAYILYGSWSWPANQYSCCCRVIQEYSCGPQCDNCPDCPEEPQ